MVSKEFGLDGKKALITGADRFWVKYAAVALAGAGADVAVAAKNSGQLEEAVEGVKRVGRKAVAIPVDITKSAQVENMAERAADELGGIDILVNTTDLEFAKPFLETTEDEWQRVMGANLDSSVFCCRAVGRRMIAQKKGRIINVTSCLGERGMANSVAYCTAAGGVLQLTRALALEWARSGVTVNAVGAGWFSETERTGMVEEDQILRYIPLKRYGHPAEVGSLLVYLASDTTDFVSGQFLYVDGAVMAHA